MAPVDSGSVGGSSDVDLPPSSPPALPVVGCGSCDHAETVYVSLSSHSVLAARCALTSRRIDLLDDERPESCPLETVVYNVRNDPPPEAA